MAPKVLRNDGEIISVEMANIAVKALAIFGILIPMTTNGLNVAIAFGLHSEIIFNSTYCPQNENEVFISMSIVASQYPEKLIFNFCVLTYAMMRLLYSFAYSYFYYHCSARRDHGVWYPRFCRGLAVESILELFSSYFVMCVGIDEHFGLHVLGFIAYSFFNLIGMGTNVVLHRASGLIKTKPTTFYIKLFVWISWFVVIFAFMAAYPIYKFHCLPWAYPLFSVLEYVSLTLISIFNACIYHDLSDFKMQFVGTWSRFDRPSKELLPRI